MNNCIAILLSLLLLGSLPAADAAPKDTPVKWDYDMPDTKAAQENQAMLHGTKRILTTYMTQSVTLDLVDLKVRIFVKNDSEGKPSIDAESNLCFTYVSPADTVTIFTIVQDNNPAIEFKATKDRVKILSGAPNKKQACFPANEMTLPSFWKEIQVK